MDKYIIAVSENQAEKATPQPIPVTGQSTGCEICGSSNTRHVFTQFGGSLFCQDCASLFGFDQAGRGVNDGRNP